MVGTAQPDSFSIFIRKIGYSVGLEDLIRRGADFGREYASVPSFREADWTRLVHDKDKWNLRSANISDVFHTLGIAQVHNHEIYPGWIGESLAISSRLLSETEYMAASRFLIALAIVSADGDIFLNALWSRFSKERTSEALSAMVSEKRRALFELFQAPKDREAIARAISIERQSTNKGGASKGTLSEFAKGSPLSTRVLGLGLPQAMDVYAIASPSPDYLRKITVSRKGWAEALGLFSESELTEQGVKFLGTLSKAEWVTSGGVFRVWPTRFEAQSRQFDERGLISLKLLDTFDFQRVVFEACGGIYSGLNTANGLASFSSHITNVFGIFRSLSQHRSMIRNEMPASVVWATAFAKSLALKEPAFDFGALLSEISVVDPAITVRSSKTIEFAITPRSLTSR